MELWTRVRPVVKRNLGVTLAAVRAHSLRTYWVGVSSGGAVLVAQARHGVARISRDDFSCHLVLCPLGYASSCALQRIFSHNARTSSYSYMQIRSRGFHRERWPRGAPVYACFGNARAM